MPRRWAATYAIFQFFIWYPLHHMWMYFFMQTNTLMVLPWTLGLLIVHWLFFGLVCCVARSKSRYGCGSEPVPLMDYARIQTPLGTPRLPTNNEGAASKTTAWLNCVVFFG